MNSLLTILLTVIAFPLSQVRLTDSRWRDNMSRDSAWVCSISTQQALHNFRTTVGQFSAYEGGYGPILLAGRLGHVENPFSNPTRHNDYYTYDYQIPDSIHTIQLRIDAIQPIPESFAEFVTDDGIRISPLYDIHHERYVVYWNE